MSNLTMLFTLCLFVGYFIGAYRKEIWNMLFDIQDIAFAYIKYVLLHRWNKLDERHIRFIEEADWSFGSVTKHKLLVKIKKLNKNP